MKSGIYIITNIVNNKKYIGSSLDYRQRIRQHKYSLRKNSHYNKHLQSSFNKYGEKNFKFELLELTDNLIERETFHIYNQKVLNPLFGYNKATIIESTSGYKMSEYSRKKMSIAKKGVKMHINTQKALIKANKERIYNTSHLRIKEVINKVSKANMKSVLQYDLLGNFIKEWDSVKEISEFYNILATNIAACCRGERLKTNEYQWFYKPKHCFYPLKVLKYKRKTGNRNFENFMRLCTEMYIEKSSELLENPEEDNQQPR
jgi:group I intron endonuclease